MTNRPEQPAPVLWGSEPYVRELLGQAVTDLRATPGTLAVDRFDDPAGPCACYRASFGPVIASSAALTGDPERRARLDHDFAAFAYRTDRGGRDGRAVSHSDHVRFIARRRPPMTDPPALPGVTHRFVDVAAQDGSLRVHVADAGTGDPLLLLHGWPQHWYMWRHVLGALAGRFRLIAPDLRGFGWTEAPGRGYDPRTFAEDAVALLDALGLDRVALAGHDWGGYTAFLLAIAHPERVERLVVFGAPHPWARRSARLVASLWRTWYVAAIASPLGPDLAAHPGFVPWFIRLGGRRHVFSDADAAIYARRLAEPARARASSLLYRSYLRSAVDVLAGRAPDTRLHTPALLVFGTDDFYVPTAYLDGWEPHAPALRLELVPGCGHFLPEERPELAIERLNGSH
jgi:pimeloyl-ACP methyl ester carboxylesterase